MDEQGLIVKAGVDTNELYTIVINGRQVGEIIRSLDGHFAFWPDPECHGSWPAHLLREIVEKIDELNARWDRLEQAGLYERKKE